MAIDISVVLAWSESVMVIFLPTKKNDEAWGDLEGLIFPDLRSSLRKSSVAFCSLGVRG